MDYLTKEEKKQARAALDSALRDVTRTAGIGTEVLVGIAQALTHAARGEAATVEVHSISAGRVTFRVTFPLAEEPAGIARAVRCGIDDYMKHRNTQKFRRLTQDAAEVTFRFDDESPASSRRSAPPRHKKLPHGGLNYADVRDGMYSGIVGLEPWD